MKPYYEDDTHTDHRFDIAWRLHHDHGYTQEEAQQMTLNLVPARPAIHDRMEAAAELRAWTARVVGRSLEDIEASHAAAVGSGRASATP